MLPWRKIQNAKLTLKNWRREKKPWKTKKKDWYKERWGYNCFPLYLFWLDLIFEKNLLYLTLELLILFTNSVHLFGVFISVFLSVFAYQYFKVDLSTAVRYRNMFGAKRKELENNLTKDEDSYFSMKFQTMQEEDELKKEKKVKIKVSSNISWF